jgi:carbon monoxide dehydrogenase subunit G
VEVRMRWIKRLGIALAVVVGLFFAIGFMLPSAWEVSRSRRIAATPEEIHAFVGDLARWPAWSPFDDEYPDMVMTVSADTTSVGAQRSWTSESMGSGTQTITATDPATGFEFRLHMEGMQPLYGRIAYEPEGDDATVVTWTDHGDLGDSPIDRWFQFALKPMLGASFEKGLAELERVVIAARSGSE